MPDPDIPLQTATDFDSAAVAAVRAAARTSQEAVEEVDAAHFARRYMPL